MDTTFVCSQDLSEELAGDRANLGFVKTLKDFVLAENAKMLRGNAGKHDEIKAMVRDEVRVLANEIKALK